MAAMRSGWMLVTGIALALSGCGSSAPPEAQFIELRPDSGVNVWTEIEVRASDYRDPAIVAAVAERLQGLAKKIRSGEIKPGDEVRYVQTLIFVNSPDDPKQKLGSIRFPLSDFIESGGDLEAADGVHLRSYGAAEPWCADDAHRVSVFCTEFEAGAT